MEGRHAQGPEKLPPGVADQVEGKDRGTFKYVDRDGNDTNEAWTDENDPATGRPIRHHHKHKGHHLTHGAIMNDPYAPIDRAGHPQYDVANREIKSDQPTQGGEDPGRVWDAAGVNTSAGYRASGANPGFSPGAAPLPVPVVPDDSPSTTPMLAAQAAEKIPMTQRFVEPESASQVVPVEPTVPTGVPEEPEKTEETLDKPSPVETQPSSGDLAAATETFDMPAETPPAETPPAETPPAGPLPLP